MIEDPEMLREERDALDAALRRRDDKPSPGELWKQAGGETESFDRERYRELMIEYGYLVPLQPGQKAEPLPCGWPKSREADTSD